MATIVMQYQREWNCNILYYMHLHIHTLFVLYSTLYILYTMACSILSIYTICYSNATSTPNKPIVDRRAHSTESLQKSVTMGGKARYSPVLALRDVVRAERESLSQSVGVSILSEKAASILGIAPPKQFKRASMYDPLLEQKIVTESPPQLPTQRSNSYHPGIKRGGKALDKGVSEAHCS